MLAPIGRDCELACGVLGEASIATLPCPDGRGVEGLSVETMGALVLTEEAIPSEMEVLERLVSRQPAWSDLPVIVFASSDPATLTGRELLDRLLPLGNVTVLERPVHRSTLVSAVRAALRARARQYEVRDLLAEHQRGLRRRDEFLAMLGHELRNPLGAIRNTLHAVALAHGAEDGGDDVLLGRRERALITRQIEHLTRLVDDLLDVSRVTSGKIVLKRERLDLAAVVSRCLQSLEAAASVHGLSLEMNVTAEGVLVDGDPTRLEQVFTNLLTNAIKYTPPRGNVEVTVGGEGAEAVVAVSDTGSGLAPDVLPRVFDLFTQAERTLERAEGGLGIGLTLVRALVRQHGGEVTARSPGPGQGSTFEVRLPLVTPPADASFTVSQGSQARTDGSAARGPGARILVVEDNADNRESLVVLLGHLGHHVTGVADGRTALATLAGGTYDLAFVDIGLPGMDGYEVARRARAAVGAAVHLVALTGYGQPEDRDRAREAGFDEHVTKPLELAVLESVLARAAVRS